MTMREATQSQRFPLATRRTLQRGEWRFAALGLQPTADQELIERAYWYQARRLRPLAETDREAARRLALLTEAYHALAPAAAEPGTTRAAFAMPARARRREQLFDIVLTVVLLLVLALAALVVLNPDARLQLNAALQHAGLLIQHLRSSAGR
jgi:hypothetical protein